MGRGGFQCGISRLRVSVSLTHFPCQRFFKDRCLAQQLLSKIPENVDVPAFAAKADSVHNSQPVKKRDGAAGKGFRAA